MSDAPSDVEYSDESMSFMPESGPTSELIAFNGRLLSTSELLATEALRGLGSSSSLTHLEDGEVDSDMEEDQAPEPTPAVGSQPTASLKRKRNLPSISNYVSKKDPRHHYANTYFSAVNSGIVAVYAQVLRDLATPDIVMASQLVTKMVDFVPKSVETHGLDANLEVYDVFYKTFPDYFLVLHSSKIRVFRNGESAIICKVELKGTKMFEMLGLMEGSDDHVVIKSSVGCESKSGETDKNGGSELADEMGQLSFSAEITSKVPGAKARETETKVSSVPFGLGEVRKTSARMHCVGTCTLYLNKDKKIFRVESILGNNFNA